MSALLKKISVCIMLMLALSGAYAVETISLQALFKDKAIVLIDGKRRVLKTGDVSPEGVKLLSTDTQEEIAEVELDAKRKVLKLGVVISSFTARGKGSATLYAESRGHYLVDGLINGVPVNFVVDTGATLVAMNSHVADRIGLDYRRNGRPSVAGTPAGYVRTYNLKLSSVQVGGITLYNIDGSVIEGSHPSEVLLGMSFLGQLDMKRDNDKMELSER
ncbi:MAG: TIGR02281 family clan AA aspartic protease [Gammaproteobacteria bacterium]|nr:TIGR02281 family clan AA aspartic protease [Gammaproteobacteria bacterium]